MTKEKHLSLLYLTFASKQDLRLEFARILYHPGEGPTSTQSQSLQLLASPIMLFSWSELYNFDTIPDETYYLSSSCHTYGLKCIICLALPDLACFLLYIYWDMYWPLHKEKGLLLSGELGLDWKYDQKLPKYSTWEVKWTWLQI